ncbi:hypothetical protein RI367_002717 [Sorochytrium milnesiophthora]
MATSSQCLTACASSSSQPASSSQSDTKPLWTDDMLKCLVHARMVVSPTFTNCQEGWQSVVHELQRQLPDCTVHDWRDVKAKLVEMLTSRNEIRGEGAKPSIGDLARRADAYCRVLQGMQPHDVDVSTATAGDLAVSARVTRQTAVAAAALKELSSSSSAGPGAAQAKRPCNHRARYRRRAHRYLVLAVTAIARADYATPPPDLSEDFVTSFTNAVDIIKRHDAMELMRIQHRHRERMTLLSLLSGSSKPHLTTVNFGKLKLLLDKLGCKHAEQHQRDVPV